MRVGAVQLNATEDTDRNLETADRLVRQAAALGAEVVVLPEKWSVLGTDEHMTQARSPRRTMHLVGAFDRTRARDRRRCGSIVERVDGRGKAANTSVHVGADGELRAVYRKLHMFDVEVDGDIYAESAHEDPGDEVVVSELPGGVRLGMTICYDVRFPELYRMLAMRGATVVTVPAAFTLATTRDHWEVLLRARAIENQCFVIAPNQIGAHPPGHRAGGRSLIVDPWGLVLASAPDAETAIVADLDFDTVQSVRKRIPALTHRRTDVYGWTV